jgi:hypothetical protein
MSCPMLLRDAGQEQKPSAMRAALLFWVLGVLGVWIFASIDGKALQAVPDSVITILGLVVGGKAAQRFAEK